MNIIFKPLQRSDFPLLLKWLTKPHVRAWWDKDIKWTPELIEEKYATYVKGYKMQDGALKAIHSYIIYDDIIPIGYIQIYNAYDFPRQTPLSGLPSSLAAFDMFIGEEKYLRKGIGAAALKLFLEDYCLVKYEAVFADPDVSNIAAIKTYEKAGFKKLANQLNKKEILMIKDIGDYIFIDFLKDLPFIQKILLFGSRARGDNSPRADIDIAIFCNNANDSDWLQVVDIMEDADSLLKIDYIRVDSLPSDSVLKENIIKEGKILYEKN